MFAISQDLFPRAVQLSASNRQSFRPTGGAGNAGEARADHRMEQIEINRLDYQIVRTKLHGSELALAVGQSGQKYEPSGPETRSLRSQPLQNIQTGHHRHDQIRQHQIGFRFDDRGPAFLTIVCDTDVVTTIDELLDNQAGNLSVVFDNQHFYLRSGHGPVSHPGSTATSILEQKQPSEQ